MPTLVYKNPAVAFKEAANTRIKDPTNNLYGSGFLPGSTVFKKLAAIYDTRAPSGAPLPRHVWTGKDLENDGEESTTFHAPGGVFSITGNIYSGLFNTSDEVDIIAGRYVELFHHQPLTLTGFVARIVNCNIVTVVEDPVGQHGIVEFSVVIRTVQ